MKIIPTSDIAIAGQHCPAGVPTDCSAADASMLIASGLAVRFPVEAAPEAAEPAIEAAAIQSPKPARRAAALKHSA